MRKISWVMMALMVITLSASAAEWVSLTNTRGPVIPSDATISVDRIDGGYELTVSIPGFYKATRSYQGDAFTMMDVPGSSLTMEKGAPELPKMTAILPLPEGAKVTGVEVTGGERIAVELEDELVPSRGHVSRSTNPESIPFVKGEAYEAVWPEKIAEAEQPFRFGAVTGVRIAITPFQYRGAERTLQAYPNLKVRVMVEGDRNSYIGEGPKTDEFLTLYSRMFNENPAVEEELRAIPAEAGNLLIICYDDFADVMKPFVAWKKKSGLQVKLVKRSEIAASATAEQIYAFIKKTYDAGQLTHLMLVGDANEIPYLRGKFESAASDACYVKLAGNDNFPDAFHCRISAQTAEQVKTQINKFMYYEAYPPQGSDAEWLKKATGIASAEGSPTDFARMGLLRDALLAFRYTVVDKIYDPGATTAMVNTAINEGRGVINYIGHGSNTTWGTTGFSAIAAGKLTNAFKVPMIWSVACVNGNFPMTGGDCFAEGWMRAGTPSEPRGAIGVLAATTNEAWVPPCDMQTEINSVQMAGEKLYSLGGLTLAGMIKGFEIWGVEDKKQGNQLNEQNILFGDSSLLLRNDIPKVVTASAKLAGKTVNFQVNNSGKYARVTVYNEDLSKSATTLVKNGTASITLPDGMNATGLRFTVYGFNLVPLIDQDI